MVGLYERTKLYENTNGIPAHPLRRNDILYPELSYAINGTLFKVFEDLGYGYQERIYQRAAAVAFTEAGIKFSEQVHTPLVYEGQTIGRYFLDFLIEDKIVLEMKQGNYFKKQNMDQIIGYLKANNLKLGLIANFTRNGVQVRRILNER
ncbi:MAG: GxxExxY protein [Candidatus Harrisonbacteria bacterium]|nr:GxxExxY protein [Candidatus Harrisonbacteria bacterium]